MLTREENELICRVGPGTPIGTLLSEEMPEPDSRPVRVRLLSEEVGLA